MRPLAVPGLFGVWSVYRMGKCQRNNKYKPKCPRLIAHCAPRQFFSSSFAFIHTHTFICIWIWNFVMRNERCKELVSLFENWFPFAIPKQQQQKIWCWCWHSFCAILYSIDVDCGLLFGVCLFRLPQLIAQHFHTHTHTTHTQAIHFWKGKQWPFFSSKLFLFSLSLCHCHAGRGLPPFVSFYLGCTKHRVASISKHKNQS